MIKCRLDKGKDHIWIKTGGTAETLSTETLVLVQQLYRGIKNKNEAAAEGFRLTVIGAMIDPSSPVWREEDHG